ncbi:hypothetical protein SAMN04488598_12429 [Halanaerobium congolense]|uniref:Uncharacterized protein n=1 Tax=Halanaerobium congolense TaxID=54121 RepID=A0A1I0BNM9_9FIRM|nr:HEPN domain-containing protein [Halanaerobium congolense]PTX16478.1 hypothetical protein C7953_1197 [Halanaerobium congolense]SDF78229.1 hypothetical protein SAMN04488598_12429 [Halanaerobium congolense]SET08626.1 hypothetical protein SAMN04515652_12429 [Halanaerobium congolense]SFP50508.1 hypothetical protein SAMN04488596_12429 [Halanaerobium congolense]
MNKTDNLFCTMKITNVPSELFSDAKFFLDKSTKTEELYELRRYQRAAAIYFCAAAEGGLNDLIKKVLENKNRKLKNWEVHMLDFISKGDQFYKNKDYFTVNYFKLRNRLYNILPKIIDEKNINWNSNEIEEFENFLELAEIRNSIVHYSRKEDVHNEKLVKILNDSENIIKSLFQKYIDIGASMEIFGWLK